MNRGAAYLRALPAPVVELSARISDAVLLEAWDVLDSARVIGGAETVQVPGVGPVEPGRVRDVWGWLVDLIKSRHTAEWEARNDAAYATITDRAAALQGVTAADAIDWDAVPDELFDGKASALDHAVAVLREHVAAEFAADVPPALPVVGAVYWAPVSLACVSVPLISGERRGVVVDTRTQDRAVVYSSRELAEAALADPAVWAPGNVERVRVAAIRAVSSRRFVWAEGMH